MSFTICSGVARVSDFCLICASPKSYDEPEILPSSSHPVCLRSADAGQSEAAKRTVNLFTVPYAFDFSRDDKFFKRDREADGKRDTVYVSNRNRSIAISASVYDPENVSKLMSHEAYMAKMEADNLNEIKYLNDETSDGRLAC
jgi:hypothetical protein